MTGLPIPGSFGLSHRVGPLPGIMNVPLQCTKCRMVLPLAVYNSTEIIPCPACGAGHEATVFPAFLKHEEAVVAERVADDSDASCFYHPAKKAMLACESCGRFVCSLCEVELNGVHLCPQCLDSGKRKGKLTSLETKRTLYDSIALALATYPLLIFYFTFITAPATVYILFRYRKMPRSLVRRGRWRWILALVIAILEIAGWCLLIAVLTGTRRTIHGHH